MPELSMSSLCAQDTVHLLAKLRTRRMLSLGSETACRGNIAEILQSFPKEDHGLNQRAIDSRDKQKYSSIELLLKPCVDECLAKLHGSHKVKGTRIYLSLMRDIRDSFFDKSLHSLCRLRKIWKSVFFLRIWGCWLEKNQYQEDTFFISNSAYKIIIIIIIINNLFTVGVINERLIAIKKLIKANYL